jgi:hypothetical protein
LRYIVVQWLPSERKDCQAIDAKAFKIKPWPWDNFEPVNLVLTVIVIIYKSYYEKHLSYIIRPYSSTNNSNSAG